MTRMRCFIVLVSASALLLVPSLSFSKSNSAKSGPVSGAERRAVVVSNYAARLKNFPLAWAQFPVRVYFERDARYSARREQWARSGFDQWVTATNGFVRYQVCDSPEQAQIVVSFDLTSNNGYTRTRFNGTDLESADISIGAKRGAGSDIACIAAHEFGHSLGIDGHSENRRDLMYPTHQMGSAWRITARDLNTLSALYPSLRGAGASVALAPRR